MKIRFRFQEASPWKSSKDHVKAKVYKNYFSKFNLFPKKILVKLDLQIVSIFEEKTFNFQSKKKTRMFLKLTTQ